MRERGNTLVELLVAVAIVVVSAAVCWTLSQGARAFGMQSAATQFDAAIAYAQTLAGNSANGATAVFDRRSRADGSTLPGFVLTVYAGRPTGAAALRASSLAPMTFAADVSEASMGGVPFTIFFDGAGHASGMQGTVDGSTVIARDPGCPSGENRVSLTFSDGRALDTRSIACNTAIGALPVNTGMVATGLGPVSGRPAAR